MRSRSTSARARMLRPGSALALLIALLMTSAVVWSTHLVVRDQERRLLTERTAEVGLVLTGAIAEIPSLLNSQGAILQATNGSAAAYTKTAAAAVLAGPGTLTFAWLRPEPGGGTGWQVLAAAGSDLSAGQIVSDSRTATFSAAARTRQLVATPVFGASRRLGFALSSSQIPAGTVLYRESVLGKVSPPRQASSAPFAELDVVIYATATVQPAQVLTSTSLQLPLRGQVDNSPLLAGSTHWLLSVRSRRPLIGRPAGDAPWLVLAGGILVSLLVAAVIETVARRRDAALALYAGEHRIGETLQRSLLPTLAVLPGLELGAKYLAAGSGQQVGGDWYDAFPLSGGRVGIAIGDVIGHDLAAASAMSQIRASLRAYAIDGAPPATVLNRLDRLVNNFDISQLVTVIYGILEPESADGGRTLSFSNAGHLPPLLRTADGGIRTLSGGDSVVIGAPIEPDHAQIDYRLAPGDTLLLFTDGLVEVPGRSLGETIAELTAYIAGRPVDEPVGQLCETIVAYAAARTLGDDVALLALRLEAPGRPGGRPREPASQSRTRSAATPV